MLFIKRGPPVLLSILVWSQHGFKILKGIQYRDWMSTQKDLVRHVAVLLFETPPPCHYPIAFYSFFCFSWLVVLPHFSVSCRCRGMGNCRPIHKQMLPVPRMWALQEGPHQLCCCWTQSHLLKHLMVEKKWKREGGGGWEQGGSGWRWLQRETRHCFCIYTLILRD